MRVAIAIACLATAACMVGEGDGGGGGDGTGNGDGTGDGNGDGTGGGNGDGTGSGSGSGSGLPAYEVIQKFGHDVIRSVTVHKNGGEDRIVYIEASRVAQAPSTGVLPDSTRLIMEVAGGGAFVIEKVAGAWQYGIVSGNPASLATAPDAGCQGCHGGAAEPGVFTAPSLRRLVTTHVGEEITCPMGPGPQPCASTVYQ